jgi:16S rRNA G966 N2-methylase RsmD
MPYQYVSKNIDYTHYSSGRVLVNLPGQPAFPIRLASEVFQRLMAMREKEGTSQPVHLFDPCCGGAYHLTVLGLLHRQQIASITASDVDPRAVEIARRNLRLLGSQGLQARIQEIEAMQTEFDKPAHAKALESAKFLLDQVVSEEATHSIQTHSFAANVFDPAALWKGWQVGTVDVVFSDLPYGLHSQWQGMSDDQSDPLQALLESLAHVLSNGTQLALATMKDVRPGHPNYTQIGKLKLGKRLVTFLRFNR